MSEEIETIRLNKYLARCGVGSRRECDTFISEGLIRINGDVVTVGTQVTGNEEITFRGRPVAAVKAKEYYLYHKPAGPLCTSKDTHGRATIFDALKELGLDAPYLKYVGRLDKESEGALILTNDGDMVHAVTHPRFHIKKVYMVEVAQKIKPENLELIVEDGVESEGEILTVGAVRFKGTENGSFWYEVDLYEGKNRQVRRVFSGIGHEVTRLIRTQFANLKLRELAYGEFRPLQEREIKGLQGKGYDLEKKSQNRPNVNKGRPKQR